MFSRTLSLAAVLVALAPLGSIGCNNSTLAKVEPQLAYSPDGGLDFGTEPVLNQKTLNLNVENFGRAPLHLTNVFILDYIDGQPGNGQAAAFSFGAVLPTSLVAGQTGAIAVVFTPTSEASFAATLHLESNDPLRPVLDLPIQGVGSTKAVIAVESEATPGQQSIDFGRVGEGQIALQGLEIHSEGTADLIIEGLTLSGDPAITFQSSAKTPVTVPTGQTLTLELEYAPPEGSPSPTSATLTIQSTDPSRPMLQVPITARVNRAPIAIIADGGAVAPGQTVTLDGSASYDPDGDDPLAFTNAEGQPGWSLVVTPINSTAQITPGNVAKPQVTFDLPGSYTVRLVVTDSTGLETLHPAEMTILAKPAQALAVVLVWDNADTDMDLHFFPSTQMFDGPYDCWAENKAPDYTALGDTSSPVLDRDALDDYGPEEMTWDEPAAGTYNVEVNLYSTHASTSPQTISTIRVYEYGEVVSEISGPPLTMAGQTWTAATLEWPMGTVTPVGTVAP